MRTEGTSGCMVENCMEGVTLGVEEEEAERPGSVMRPIEMGTGEGMQRSEQT